MVQMENEIPESIEAESTPEAKGQIELKNTKSNRIHEKENIRKFRKVGDRAQKLIFSSAFPKESSVRKMLSIYAPQVSRRGPESWLRYRPSDPSKSAETKKSPRQPLIANVPTDSQLNTDQDGSTFISENIQVCRHEGPSQNQPACQTPAPSNCTVLSESSSKSFVMSFCNRFATWDFFMKASDAFEKSYSKIKFSNGVEFKDLPFSKKVALVEDIIVHILLPATQKDLKDRGSVPKIKGNETKMPSRTVDEVLQCIQKSQPAQHSICPAEPKRVGFQLSSEVGDNFTLDFQLFFSCIRRIAERFDRTQLLFLFSSAASKPTSPWSSLPSVVTWNVSVCTHASRRGKQDTVNPPATPWSKAHRKSVLRPRTSVRRLLALQVRCGLSL